MLDLEELAKVVRDRQPEIPPRFKKTPESIRETKDRDREDPERQSAGNDVSVIEAVGFLPGFRHSCLPV